MVFHDRPLVFLNRNPRSSLLATSFLAVFPDFPTPYYDGLPFV
jgi:hypothetical protein